MQEQTEKMLMVIRRCQHSEIRADALKPEYHCTLRKPRGPCRLPSEECPVYDPFPRKRDT